MLEKTNTWLPRCLGLLVFCWYLLAASPGFFWLDSAELSASAVGLGAAHPTGFPLYLLLGKVASLLPIGELAFRINLLSAICAALAVFGVVRLIASLGKDDWPTLIGAAGGGAALAFSFLFARQATVAEVYAPTAAFIVLTLYLFDKVVRGANADYGLSLAWIAGMGIALHPSYRMLMGIPLLVIFSVRLYRGARWPLLSPVVTSLSAFALHLYLPIRSATGRIALLDWGHPNTLSKTIDHANASEIRRAFADEMMSMTPEIVNQHALTFFQQVVDSLGLLGLFAAVAGLVYLVVDRKTRWMGTTLVAILVIDSVYSVWINPMGLVDSQNGVPLLVALCIGAGVSVANFSKTTGLAAPFVSAALVFVIVIPPALVSVPTIGNGSNVPRDVSENTLELLPASIVFLQSDSNAAGTSFLKVIEGARPDIATLIVPMLSDRQSVEAMLRESSEGEFSLPEAGNIISLVLASPRSKYWENGEFPAPSKGLVLGPVVSRLVNVEESQILPNRSARTLAELYSQSGLHSRVGRRSFAHTLTNLGRFALGQGQLPLAQSLFQGALNVHPKQSEARTNLGVILSRQNKMQDAIRVTEEVLDYDPNRTTALVNAARYHMVGGNLQKAEQHASRALRIAPQNAAAWQVAGLIAFKGNKHELAAKRLETSLLINPNSRVARGALAQIRAILTK